MYTNYQPGPRIYVNYSWTLLPDTFDNLCIFDTTNIIQSCETACTCYSQLRMTSPKEPIQFLWRLNVDAYGQQLLPKRSMRFGWAAEQQIINIDRQEELSRLNPV